MAENQNNNQKDGSGKQKKSRPPKRIELVLGKDIKINYQTNQYKIPFAVYTKAADGSPEEKVLFCLQDESLQALKTNLNALQTGTAGAAQGIIVIPCDSNVGHTVHVTARRDDMPMEFSTQVSAPLPVSSKQSWRKRTVARWQNSETKKTILWHAIIRIFICGLIMGATVLFSSTIKIGVLLLCAGLMLAGLSSSSRWTIVGLVIAGISLWQPEILDNSIIYAAIIGAITIPLSFSFEELAMKKQKIERDGDVVEEHIFNTHPKVIASLSLLAVIFYSLCLAKTILLGHVLEPQSTTIDIDSLHDASTTDVIAEIINEPQQQPSAVGESTRDAIATGGRILWFVLSFPFHIFPKMSTSGGCLQGILQYLLLFLLIITLETPQELASFWKGDQVSKQGEQGSGKVEGKVTLESMIAFKEIIDIFRWFWHWLKKSWR